VLEPVGMRLVVTVSWFDGQVRVRCPGVRPVPVGRGLGPRFLPEVRRGGSKGRLPGLPRAGHRVRSRRGLHPVRRLRNGVLPVLFRRHRGVPGVPGPRPRLLGSGRGVAGPAGGEGQGPAI